MCVFICILIDFRSLENLESSGLPRSRKIIAIKNFYIYKCVAKGPFTYGTQNILVFYRCMSEFLGDKIYFNETCNNSWCPIESEETLTQISVPSEADGITLVCRLCSVPPAPV